ncbi:MAG: hypothetical protein ACODAD_05565 [Planctomycetota bacterium]
MRLEPVRVGDWKLWAASGQPDPFPVVTGPFERINRVESGPETVAELTARMKQMAEEVGMGVRGL